ncbi:hypothetical protein LJB80_00245 [Bacteroides sp. OttesenSCG-928-F21]|nr:hypothetical protein [Bacteroides sp. OttesenSCG-928-F21]
MEFTGEITKKATSTVGVYLMEYTIFFNVNNVPTHAKAIIKEGNIAVAVANYKAIKAQVSIVFLDEAMVGSDDRIQLYTSFEKDIKKIFK